MAHPQIKDWNASNKARGVSALIEEMRFLLKLSPADASFLGKKLEYEKVSGLFQKKNETLNIIPLRQSIMKPDKGHSLMLRKDLDYNLRKYPSHPELHALHAIQVFKDTMQGGVKDQKLNIIKNTLREISIAVHNGADSVVILLWFSTIYSNYLDMIKDRVGRVIKQAKEIPNSEIAALRRLLLNQNMQLTYLQGVKEKLSGLKKINELLRDSNYVYEALTQEELVNSCKMLLQGQDSQNLKGTHKKASHLIYTNFIKILLFANIPMLKPTLIKNMKLMPEIHRDLVLQKRMIIVADGINDFKYAIFNSQREAALEGAKKLLKFCQITIHEFLETSILSKQFEVDPYLKFAWVIKEAEGLFSKEEIKTFKNQAIKYLNILIGKRCLVKNATEQAQDYLFEFNTSD